MTALVLTRQLPTASVLLQMTGLPAAITNLLPNPGFEVDTTDWQEQGTGTVLTRTTAQKDTGAASGLLTMGAISGLALRSLAKACAVGDTIGLRFRVRFTGPGTTDLSAAVRFIQADGATTTQTVTGAVLTAPNNTWVTVSVVATAPALTAFFRVQLNRIGTTNGQLVWVDSVVARKLSAWETFDPAFYFEGTLPQSFTLTRSDANGVAPVRLRDGQVPINGVLTVTDYEPALMGGVTYDVIDTQGTRTTASTTFDGQGVGPRIVGVQEPQLSSAPELITGYDAARESSSAVLRVLGRADPVIVMQPTRTREGQLEVWCRDYADAHDVETVLSEARILLLRQPTHPGLDMYFLAQSVSTTTLRHTSQGWRWGVTARYVELRNPTLPLLGGAGWTFDDLVTLYPTFGTVRSTYATFAALTVGP